MASARSPDTANSPAAAVTRTSSSSVAAMIPWRGSAPGAPLHDAKSTALDPRVRSFAAHAAMRMADHVSINTVRDRGADSPDLNSGTNNRKAVSRSTAAVAIWAVPEGFLTKVNDRSPRATVIDIVHAAAITPFRRRPPHDPRIELRFLIDQVPAVYGETCAGVWRHHRQNR
jgi:hypothetical protein